MQLLRFVSLISELDFLNRGFILRWNSFSFFYK